MPAPDSCIHQWHIPAPARVTITRACPISNKYLLRYLYITWLVFFDVIWSIRFSFYFRCSSAAHPSAFLLGLQHRCVVDLPDGALPLTTPSTRWPCGLFAQQTRYVHVVDFIPVPAYVLDYAGLRLLRFLFCFPCFWTKRKNLFSFLDWTGLS